MEAKDTKELILDAAESLFAAEGYHGTSVRAITKEAGVNLASISYHFGSKELLLEALFEHRFGPLNRTRKEDISSVLKRAREEGRTPDVKDILEAFISPMFRDDSGQSCLGRLSTLVHLAHSGQDAVLMSALVKTMKPVVDLLFKALSSALPEVSPEDLRWKMHFFIGGFSHTIRISLMHGKGLKVPTMPKATKREKLVDMMVSYFSAGMEAG